MSGGHFKNLQEVSEFSWFILAKSAAKGSGFVNGALQIEDPGKIDYTIKQMAIYLTLFRHMATQER